MTDLARWTLDIVLLVVVWRHSHWSVALTLTLQALSIEGLVAILKKKEILNK